MSKKIFIDKGETWDDINGSRLQSGYEINGIKEGVWEYFDPETEILIEKATYKSGMRDGKAYTFLAMDKWQYEEENKVNRVWHEQIYKNDDLYQDIYFHKDGGYTVEHRKNCIKHGIEEGYYPNGNIYFKRKFINGKIQGFDKYFFEDGSKKLVCFKVNGRLHGDYLSYQEDGNFLKRSNYENDYISGLFIENHFRSNKVKCRGSYIPLKDLISKDKVLEVQKDRKSIRQFLRDRKIDLKNVYGIEGKIFGFRGYRISLKNGLWEYFDEQGTLKTSVFFKNGKRVRMPHK